MSGLKEIRNRIKSVKSTRKITSAMKMIAATKLRKAGYQVVAARPYAALMSQLIADLLERDAVFENMPKLLVGTPEDNRILVIIITSDRGLCGGFNTNVVRAARDYMAQAHKEGKTTKIVCVGRRGYDSVRVTSYASDVLKTFSAFEQPKFYQAKQVAKVVLDLFAQDAFDRCVMFYSHFHTAISQTVTKHQLIPYNPLPHTDVQTPARERAAGDAIYDYEPSEAAVLDQLLPNNFETQLYLAMLENTASEHGARMTAMDGATRNSNDMIDRLNLSYNRTRQSIVTNELTEIVSGAEAL